MSSIESLSSQSGKSAKYHHPYTPYDVQLEFMKAVYGVLEKGDGQIGIIESPTGTGKSLSLICSAMTWLRSHKSSEFEQSVNDTKEQYLDEPDWIVDQLLSQKRRELGQKWEEREDKLEKIRQKEKAMEQRSNKRRRMEEARAERAETDDIENRFLLEDIQDMGRNDNDMLSGFSKETRNLLSSLGLGGPRKKEDEDDVLEEPLKIYYASRTHSQLSQFIAELRRPEFPSSLPISLQSSNDADKSKEPVKSIPLSSRKNLCINSQVSCLSSVQAINDRCAELQQSKSGAKCKYMPGEDLLSQTHQFRDTALATLPDIEDLYRLGKSLSVCPYYASRTAVAGAEIITLPYPLLLQKSARDTLGIKLEGNVVIIDEAHNIMDAISSVHAASIKLSELNRGRQMLGIYVKKFGKKLKPENRVQVGRVGRVMECLISWLTEAQNGKGEHAIVSATELLSRKGADQINMFKLVEYVQESKLAYKIEGYLSYVEAEQAKQEGKSAPPAPSKPVLQTLVSFLLALTNLSFEGRIFFQKLEPRAQNGDVQLSYLLLSPTQSFASIASSARAVILAGGTMSPFNDYVSHLFPHLPPSKITTLSCGHVIPPSNLCVWTLGNSRNGSFEFSFQRRSDKDMISQLGMSLLNMCNVVPDGMVVFFPSYGYLEEVVKVWQGNSKDHNSIWGRLQSRKAIFCESKTASSDVTLQAYTAAIMETSGVNSSKGAMLLGVVGGKMSEGINFSDQLGRCVVIVGLPFPNINSPDWKAKMEYIETSAVERLTKPEKQGEPLTHTSALISHEQAVAMGKKEAREFYENACMRAVNQSIGRAIRHRNDYAAIILVDRRYGTQRIQDKLPRWIRGGMVSESHEKGLPELMGTLGNFFRAKKSI
ncbi:ATP-dependent DNA helicase CHL1 [Ceratocystis fimbriata CBS 114723]|uniref:ATP-dependent DNA helicase CHL1 n=1 Tax=Ceratocystis fimbriata CBS 114723 TaxID=1035309 RepID=A0A2C5XN13_9PEZI|nr:ATP-dependent DNA helicase CHL1 [Ceratocystis fimbriata CBS 114723]